MLLPFDVRIIYLLDVNKCTPLVSGGIHSNFLEILLWSATAQDTGAIKYLIIIIMYVMIEANIGQLCGLVEIMGSDWIW